MWKGHLVIAGSVNKTFAVGKLTHHSSDGMGLTGRVSGHGWSISRGRSGGYKWYQSWLAILVLT